MSEGPSFRPAKPQGLVLWLVQTYLRCVLAWWNRPQLDPRDLDVLRNLPEGAGVILVSNHADEVDVKVCIDLSRRGAGGSCS